MTCAPHLLHGGIQCAFVLPGRGLRADISHIICEGAPRYGDAYRYHRRRFQCCLHRDPGLGLGQVWA
jgi:hypothetical protein